MNKLFVSLALMSVMKAARYTTNDGGPTFEITFDKDAAVYKFEVNSPIGKDLWLVFANDCDRIPCDIV